MVLNNGYLGYNRGWLGGSRQGLGLRDLNFWGF